MAIYSYRLARGQTRWMFTIDLPAAADGKRRQLNRKGFLRQEDAQAAEAEARKAYARADLAVDGSLAAELEAWLAERELDVAETTLGNYRDIVKCYIVPHLGSRPVYALNSRAIHDLYRTLIKRGGKNGRPLSRTTVRTVHRVLMKALGDLHVVLDGVRKPRKEERETQGRKGVWTSEEAARFLIHHADHRPAWGCRGGCSACSPGASGLGEGCCGGDLRGRRLRVLPGGWSAVLPAVPDAGVGAVLPGRRCPGHLPS